LRKFLYILPGKTVGRPVILQHHGGLVDQLDHQRYHCLVMSQPSSVPTVITRRFKRNATTELAKQPEKSQKPDEKLEIQLPLMNKWETIITTSIGELCLSILRGPQNLPGDVQWIPGSCCFLVRLSSDAPSSYLSSIKIDKKIIEVFEKANTQNKRKEDETINELLVYG